MKFYQFSALKRPHFSFNVRIVFVREISQCTSICFDCICAVYFLLLRQNWKLCSSQAFRKKFKEKQGKQNLKKFSLFKSAHHKTFFYSNKQIGMSWLSHYSMLPVNSSNIFNWLCNFFNYAVICAHSSLSSVWPLFACKVFEVIQ